MTPLSKASPLQGFRVSHGLSALSIVVATAAILLAMGRTPICTCGTVKLWHGSVNSAENSQHLMDWYTPSHMIHGFVFFAGFALLRKFTARHIVFSAGLLGALVIEAAWEVAENTPMMIERYRTATIALGYNGDSVINSIADMAAMMVGFVLAARLPVFVSIGLVIAAELIVGFVIRDNLTLNVIMLLWPIEAIKAWQAGL